MSLVTLKHTPAEYDDKLSKVVSYNVRNATLVRLVYRMFIFCRLQYHPSASIKQSILVDSFRITWLNVL